MRWSSLSGGRSRCVFAALFVLTLAAASPAQTLVENINPGVRQRASGADEFITSGSLTFFRATSPLGIELWVTDRSTAGTFLAKDIKPGTGSSAPQFFGDLDGNGTVVFCADDGVHGCELWRSDGTANGTFLVKDIKPGSEGSTSRGFFKIGTELYFSADDGTNGAELWKNLTLFNARKKFDVKPGKV